MQARVFGFAFLAATLTLASCNFQQSSSSPSSALAIPLEVAGGYPIDVELVEEPNGYTYHQPNTAARLYLANGKCDEKCEEGYAPLRVSGDGGRIGPWTSVTRADGSKQWAFKEQPVYTFREDTPAQPMGESANFKLMPHYR